MFTQIPLNKKDWDNDKKPFRRKKISVSLHKFPWTKRIETKAPCNCLQGLEYSCLHKFPWTKRIETLSLSLHVGSFRCLHKFPWTKRIETIIAARCLLAVMCGFTQIPLNKKDWDVCPSSSTDNITPLAVYTNSLEQKGLRQWMQRQW